MFKMGWLWLGFVVGRYIFRRKGVHGYEIIQRLREIGGM